MTTYLRSHFAKHFPMIIAACGVGFITFAIFLMFGTSDSFAQSLTLDMGDGNGGNSTATGRIVQLVGLMTVLSLAPAILVVMTSFTRIVVVFSFLRSALGVQQTPPNMVIISLALFMTGYIMEPVFIKSYEEGLAPLMSEQIDEITGFERAAAPFKDFMLDEVREEDLALFMDMANLDNVETPKDLPHHVVIPAFIISELKRAFEIGFLLFVPFIIIDMVVASVLMSMGMMMLPPVFISLPFKLIFFVLVDGWQLVVGSLIRSFAT